MAYAASELIHSPFYISALYVLKLKPGLYLCVIKKLNSIRYDKNCPNETIPKKLLICALESHISDVRFYFLLLSLLLLVENFPQRAIDLL